MIIETLEQEKKAYKKRKLWCVSEKEDFNYVFKATTRSDCIKFLRKINQYRAWKRGGSEYRLFQVIYDPEFEKPETDSPCPHCGREENGKWFTPCPSDDCPGNEIKK